MGKKSRKSKARRIIRRVAKYRRPSQKGLGLSSFLTGLNIPLTVIDHQGEKGRPDWELMHGNFDNAIGAFRSNIGYTFGTIAGIKEAFLPFALVQVGKKFAGNARLAKIGKYAINVL